MIAIEDPLQPVTIKVFDYDWGLQDDFMGQAMLYLTSIDLNVETVIHLKLEDSSDVSKNCGELLLHATLIPKTQEDKEQVNQKFTILIINKEEA